MTKRILITGHNGYIGSVMVPEFLKSGYEVVGMDSGYFENCTLVPDQVAVPEIRKDIRDLRQSDLSGFDAVVHLAALSNDPIGNLSAAWTEDINLKGSIRLAELARASGVRRFLFSSSCIMYGMSEAAVATEESPLDPKTVYAASKVEAEKAISALVDERFSPTFLRNGTVYGVSPRMRFDTVFNDFIGSAVTTGKVIVYSNGQPWRPVVHVQDVARAFVAVLEAPVEKVHNQAFNTGCSALNHRVIELAEIAAGAVPGCKLKIEAQAGADQRTYKADFGKFQRTFPDFHFNWTPREGAQELSEAFQRIGLRHEDFVNKRFTRLKWLRHLLDSEQLDQDLRWRNGRNGGSHD